MTPIINEHENIVNAKLTVLPTPVAPRVNYVFELVKLMT